jgi:hypothetical protein
MLSAAWTQPPGAERTRAAARRRVRKGVRGGPGLPFSGLRSSSPPGDSSLPVKRLGFAILPLRVDGPAAGLLGKEISTFREFPIRKRKI